LGAVTISGNEVKRNPAYYIIGHASKYVRPGSVRLASNLPDQLPNVAFQNPKGDIVLIVLNDSSERKNITVEVDDRFISDVIQAGSVSTYVIEI
jgi:glucosylceramidase